MSSLQMVGCETALFRLQAERQRRLDQTQLDISARRPAVCSRIQKKICGIQHIGTYLLVRFYFFFLPILVWLQPSSLLVSQCRVLRRVPVVVVY